MPTDQPRKPGDFAGWALLSVLVFGFATLVSSAAGWPGFAVLFAVVGGVLAVGLGLTAIVAKGVQVGRGE